MATDRSDATSTSERASLCAALPVDRIRGLAARFTGLAPLTREAGLEIAAKIDTEAAEISREATSILGWTIPTEGGRQFLSRAEFDLCLDFLARLSGRDEWAWLRKGDHE